MDCKDVSSASCPLALSLFSSSSSAVSVGCVSFLLHSFFLCLCLSLCLCVFLCLCLCLTPAGPEATRASPAAYKCSLAPHTGRENKSPLSIRAPQIGRQHSGIRIGQEPQEDLTSIHLDKRLACDTPNALALARLPRTRTPGGFDIYLPKRTHNTTARTRFKAQGSRLQVQGPRFKVGRKQNKGSRFKAQSSRFKAQGSSPKVQGSRFQCRGRNLMPDT